MFIIVCSEPFKMFVLVHVVLSVTAAAFLKALVLLRQLVFENNSMAHASVEP
jgi:hypothetical protein